MGEIKINAGEAIMVGEPAIDPPAMLKSRLIDYFKSTIGISSAYFAQIFLLNRFGDRPHLLLCIKLLSIPLFQFYKKKYMAAVLNIINQTLEEAEYVDIYFFSKNDEVSQTVIENCRPFYAR